MKAKPIIPRARANQDIDDAISYYLSEGAEQAALGFIDALERTYKRIGRHPEAGSSRYAHELDLPGLRGAIPIWCSIWSARTTSMCGASCTASGIYQPGCSRVTESTGAESTKPLALSNQGLCCVWREDRDLNPRCHC